MKVTVTFNAPEVTTEEQARQLVDAIDQKFGGTTVYIPVVQPRGTVNDVTFVSATAEAPVSSGQFTTA